MLENFNEQKLYAWNYELWICKTAKKILEEKRFSDYLIKFLFGNLEIDNLEREIKKMENNIKNSFEFKKNFFIE